MAKVALVMGSKTDWNTLKDAAKILEEFKISYETLVCSAHRTPEEMLKFAKESEKNGFKILIAAAGGAAHLPGMLASATILPVIGVPVALDPLQGLDSLLSIAQMPKGVPVATVSIGNGVNAALLATQILALDDKNLQKKLIAYKESLKSLVEKMNQELRLEKNKAVRKIVKKK